MRVLMLTSRLDREDWQYGFTHDWVVALAARVTSLDVICQVAGSVDLPDNVTVTPVRGKQRIPKLNLILRFQRAVLARIRQVDVVFAHLGPPYALLAMPVAMPGGVPIVHWYTHGGVSLLVLLSDPFMKCIVTAAPESYALKSKRVRVVGHGIDFGYFAPSDQWPPDERTVISLGRLAGEKDWETLIDAAALLLRRPGFEEVVFRVAGSEASEVGRRAVLNARVEERGLGGSFEFVGSIPYSKIPEFYLAGTVMVSTSLTGGIDKVVLEAMGCGLPTMVTDSIYQDLLGEQSSLLLARERDPADLADRLARLLAMTPESLTALGLELRARAVRDHNLEGLADRVVSVFQEVVA